MSAAQKPVYGVDVLRTISIAGTTTSSISPDKPTPRSALNNAIGSNHSDVNVNIDPGSSLNGASSNSGSPTSKAQGFQSNTPSSSGVVVDTPTPIASTAQVAIPITTPIMAYITSSALSTAVAPAATDIATHITIPDNACLAHTQPTTNIKSPPPSDISKELECDISVVNSVSPILRQQNPVAVLRCLSAKSAIVTPHTLLYIRIAMLLYTTATIAWRMSVNPAYMYFLTNWSWVWLWIYLMTTCIHSYMYIKNQLVPGSFLDRIIPYILSIAFTLSVITVTVFWALLSKSLNTTSSTLETLSLVNGHTITLLFGLIDLFLCRTLLHLHHALGLVATVAAYIGCVWLVSWRMDIPLPYPFFPDLRHGALALPILVTVAGIVVAWLVSFVPFGLVSVRHWLIRRSRGRLERLGRLSII
ncbi:hypothetical protein BSLG_010442 [Batrachochytrium salamandrivorans]|nr:hypothetical protein BSLG_010442 [Batrachochytrium salamandrivorans]